MVLGIVALPTALEQSIEGIGRVAKIVKAIKEFSHPGGDDRKLADHVTSWAACAIRSSPPRKSAKAPVRD